MNTIALQKNQTAGKKWGFSSCSLKILALFLMTLDHIYVYLGDALLSAPHIFTLLGRISAPLFLFVMAEGFSHTHNRLSYLKRLYIASVIMSIGDSVCDRSLHMRNWIVSGQYPAEKMEKSPPAHDNALDASMFWDSCPRNYEQFAFPIIAIYTTASTYSGSLAYFCGRFCLLGNIRNRILFFPKP